VQQRTWQHFFALGFAPGERQIDVGKVCGPVGAESIETSQSFPQAVIGGLTRAIYTPYTARVRCAGNLRP
jgi:hypothetical protein